MSYKIIESKELLTHYLSNNCLAIFPTDTVYGIGCKLGNVNGVDQIFKLKRRPDNFSIAVLVNSTEMAKTLGYFDERYVQLIHTHWPGPLTVVVNSKIESKQLRISKDDSIGIRWPKSTLLDEIISITGPLVTTSVNLHGQPPATHKKEVVDFLLKIEDANNKETNDGEIAVYLEATSSAQPSTVIDLRNNKVTILREGAIDRKSITQSFNN